MVRTSCKFPSGLWGVGIPTVTDVGSLVHRAGVTWPSASRWRPHARTGAAHPEPTSQASHVAPAGLQRTGSVEKIWYPGGLDEPAFDTEPGSGARAPPTLWGDHTSAPVVLGKDAEPPWGQRGSVRALLAAGKQGKGLLTKPLVTW